MEFKHISVLFAETMAALNIRPGGVYADGTLGGGGHALGILERGEKIRLVGIDQDKEAIAAARERLAPFAGQAIFVNQNFCRIKTVLAELGISAIDGAVLDLGVSSYQLDNAERGFSYMHDAKLDMRMDRENPKSAYDVVNGYTKEELTRIFYEYGEENWSKRIAEFIVEHRQAKPLETTGELVEVIRSAIPRAARKDGSHPAKRVFQAIRIEVNDELGILKKALEDFADVLNPGGRLAVITFHSLEDRIAKQVFAQLAAGCTCPKNFPVCVCGKNPQVRLITKKPILPSAEELRKNIRSKSAKLRVVEKI